jgi:hypothetical protein
MRQKTTSPSAQESREAVRKPQGRRSSSGLKTGGCVIEIHWGDKVYQFKTEAEALEAGFHLKTGIKAGSSTGQGIVLPVQPSQPSGPEKQ